MLAATPVHLVATVCSVHRGSLTGYSSWFWILSLFEDAVQVCLNTIELSKAAGVLRSEYDCHTYRLGFVKVIAVWSPTSWKFRESWRLHRYHRWMIYAVWSDLMELSILYPGAVFMRFWWQEMSQSHFIASSTAHHVIPCCHFPSHINCKSRTALSASNDVTWLPPVSRKSSPSMDKVVDAYNNNMLCMRDLETSWNKKHRKCCYIIERNAKEVL